MLAPFFDVFQNHWFPGIKTLLHRIALNHFIVSPKADVIYRILKVSKTRIEDTRRINFVKGLAEIWRHPHKLKTGVLFNSIERETADNKI